MLLDIVAIFIPFALGVIVGELLSPHALLWVAMDNVKKAPSWVSILRTIGTVVILASACGVINVTVYELVHRLVVKS